jgi:uncharacterized protein YndB with AHSA1/START domain
MAKEIVSDILTAPGSNYMNGDKEVFITRVFNAPRKLVFTAWTDPEHLARWYAPDGCTVFFKRFEFRPGGSFHSCIKTPNLHDCWCTGTYLQIMEPEKIVFTMTVADENGNPVDPAFAGMDPDWPGDTTVTVTFTEQDGKTTLTLHQTVSESLAKRTGAHPSWLSMLNKLAAEL